MKKVGSQPKATINEGPGHDYDRRRTLGALLIALGATGALCVTVFKDAYEDLLKTDKDRFNECVVDEVDRDPYKLNIRSMKPGSPNADWVAEDIADRCFDYYPYKDSYDNGVTERTQRIVNQRLEDSHPSTTLSD